MKKTEENLDETDFEEVQSEEKKAEVPKGANRPDIRIVQPDVDREGKARFVSVGGMWKSISKNGNEFYTVRIGNLKLLAFPNDKNKTGD